jgi:hypothetical protein
LLALLKRLLFLAADFFTRRMASGVSNPPGAVSSIFRNTERSGTDFASAFSVLPATARSRENARRRAAELVSDQTRAADEIRAHPLQILL